LIQFLGLNEANIYYRKKEAQVMTSKYGNWEVVGESEDDGTYLVNPVFPNNAKQGYEVECDRTLELGKVYEGRVDSITSHATLTVEEGK
jgi:hypothetical protein